MISIHRFSYAGYSSEDFDLICQLSFEDSSGETSTFLSKEAVASETYRGEIQRVSSYKYTEVLAPTITLIDKNFGNFDINRQRKILKWLTSKNMPSFLTVYHDDSDVISYEILGNWTEVNAYKLGSGRVVGFQCVFSSVSPYAFSPLKTITKDISDPTNNTININIETDEPETLVYPRITIKHGNTVVVDVTQPVDFADRVPGTVYCYTANNIKTYYWIEKKIDSETNTPELDSSGNIIYEPKSSTNQPDIDCTSIVIKHNELNTKITFANNVANGEVVIDGANRLAYDKIHSSRVIGDDFSWNWLGLKDGNNTLSFIGNATVTIEYREPIKAGSC